MSLAAAESGCAEDRKMRRTALGRQRGAALIVLMTVLILGVAWFTVGALNKVATQAVERETKTAPALKEAKQALLGYLAQYAARPDASAPGMMPCPESVALTSPGEASPSCSNVNPTVGRLPWKTLGIRQLRDGDDEPLWYVLSPKFRAAPINLDTVGSLSFSENGVTATEIVALVIAPGRPLNTMDTPGTPTGACARVNQQVGTRNNASLNPANFIECGNVTGAYANLGRSDWTNDRAIAITTTEWLNAIMPVMGDRLQKEVMVALRNWDAAEQAATGRSWGATHGLAYLPFASTWGDPTATDYCGNAFAFEGLMPIEMTCSVGSWTGSADAVGGLQFDDCSNPGGTAYRVCRFHRKNSQTPLRATLTLEAADVGLGFRSTIAAQDLEVTFNGIVSVSMAISGLTHDATANIVVTWPNSLAVGTNVEVRVPHLQSAAVLSDSRLTWFRNNAWHRFAYYAVAPGATVSPFFSCVNPGDTGCLTVSGWPAANGVTNDKRLVLILAERKLAGQTRPSAFRTAYFESGNTTTGDRTFITGPSTAAFNDRVAACPYTYTPAGGTATQICD